MSKKYSSPNGNANGFSNRVSSPKVESTAWPDTNKQYRSNAESPRKYQNKYLGNRSQLGKFQNKTNQFNSYSYDEKLNQNVHETNVKSTQQKNSYTPSSSSPEQSINDSTLPSDDSIIINGGQDEFCDSLTKKLVKHQTLTQSHTDTEMLNIDTSSSMSNNDISPLASLPSLISAYANNSESHFNIQVDNNQYCTQNTLAQQITPNTTPSMQFSCSPYLNEINCNTSNPYYECDYSSSSNNAQKNSPMYVYHQQNQQAYTDYLSANTFAPITSPQQQQQQPQGQFGVNNTSGNYYPNYSYMYDPSNVMYSPMTSPQQSQSVSILNSYQTPPPPQHQQQLYISASSTGGESTAPNSSSSTTTTTSSEHLTSPNICSMLNSPPNNQTTALLNSPQPPNPYMMYSPSNAYMNNTAGFNSPLPSSSSPYMMYAQPSPMQAQSFNSPVSSGNNMNYKLHNNVNNKQNHFNNNYSKSPSNYKKSYSNHTSSLNNSTNLDQSSSQYIGNGPVSNSTNLSCCVDENNNLVDAYLPPSLPVNGTPSYSPPMPSYGFEGYDPNTLVQMGINPMTYDYGHSNITTYGEDVYDENYDDSNLDDNDEQLACYTCRGRRMCFCYFLKVRYYKFPSFFDLVDHQYKKWRQSMNRSKRAAMMPQ